MIRTGARKTRTRAFLYALKTWRATDPKPQLVPGCANGLKQTAYARAS